MSRRWIQAAALAAVLGVLAAAGCSKGRTAKTGTPGANGPAEASWSFKPDRTPAAAPARPTYAFKALPPKPTNPDELFYWDFRYADLTKLDLSKSQDLLLGNAIFNAGTKWPAGKLPSGFDPKKILESGKDPGLGIRDLQKQGITGKGVHVAVIDQTLYLGHPEYKDRLDAYHEIQVQGSIAQAHGTAAVSILAGKTTGVAPGVRLTYYAVQTMENNAPTYKYLAMAVHAILDNNANATSTAEQVQVIAIPASWAKGASDSLLLDQAIARAHRERVFVISGALEHEYGVKLQGAGRDPLASPNETGAYRPARTAEFSFYNQPDAWWGLYVPIDSRTVAGPSGPEDWAFLRSGGISLAPPYLAGVYALAKQVKPALTPEEFLTAAFETGSTVTFTQNGKTYKLGPLLNPQGLIQRISAEKK